MVKNLPRYDTYPWKRIIPRWLFGIAEIGVSLYITFLFNKNFGLLYAAFWGFSLFVLLPLIRCTKCYYYGKRCNTAWGLLAGFAFPKGEAVYFQAGYGLTILLWPLRILPIGLGVLGLLDGLSFVTDGLFAIYLAVIILHRFYYRAVNCPICHQKEICPVYDPQVLMRKAVGQDSQSP